MKIRRIEQAALLLSAYLARHYGNRAVKYSEVVDATDALTIGLRIGREIPPGDYRVILGMRSILPKARKALVGEIVYLPAGDVTIEDWHVTAANAADAEDEEDEA